jgi:two-component system sensor histidine kinase QseC
MRSIRFRLTRRLLLVSAVLLGGGLVAVYFATRAALRAQFDATLRAKALAISTLTKQERDRVEVDFSDRFMRGFDDDVASDFFQMWRADGQVVERSESLKGADLPRRFGALDAPAYFNLDLPADFAGRAVGFKFTPKASRQTGRSHPPIEAVLVVAADRRGLDKTLATLALVLTGCAVLLAGATLAVVPRVLRAELRPLGGLAEQAAAIRAESLAKRFPDAGLPTELQPITTRLNELLARLEESFERERRFSADLAHELRTPLAELRGLSEFAVKWPESRDPNTDSETFAIALHLQSLVTKMLALARSEHGQIPVTREPVALRPLVESVWRAFAERAQAKRLQVELDVPAGAAVETDPTLLRCILSDLLDNAVEYTPAGGLVRVEGPAGATPFTLRVTNTAENLDAADVPRLFERFWRKDKARSDSEHAGLGLALAHAFAQALGWELSAALEPEARLTLTLAAARSEDALNDSSATQRGGFR